LTDAVRSSQEHFNGSGYPDGIAGDQIPLAARIIAVADAYHAMCSDRPYRAALPLGHAIAELERCAGTQFDPRVVAALVEVVVPTGADAAAPGASGAGGAANDRPGRVASAA